MGPVNETNEPKYLTRSVLPGADWDTFFDAVQEAFNLHLKSAGPPGQRAPILVSDYPKLNDGSFDKKFDVITFHCAGSERAASSPGGERIPKGPQLRERKPHPTKARYTLVSYAWWELMTTRFTIYALSHDRASELCKWFHLFMMEYAFGLSFFKARGINYFTFKQRGEDKFSRENGQELHTRTLEYDVRIEIIQNFEYKNLESLNIQVGTNPVTEIDLVEQYDIPKP